MTHSISIYDLLRSTLKNARIEDQAEAVFVEWPELEQISVRFLRFVSPWLMIDEENVAEETLRNAFAAYEEKVVGRKEFPHRCFMEAIAKCVDLLATVRVSVMSEDGLWEIWSYDEPLMSWMEKKHRSAMQIRNRDVPVDSGPLLIKMFAFISSTRDMQLAEISIGLPMKIFQ